ncbi:MAG TPA: protein kinase, partial [Hyalangium sp.]|nr:protein kinase [Hyalangium sp.]
AVRVGQEHAGPVALKVAMMPGDARLAQEAQLLLRLNHPSLPRLEDAGEWEHGSGEVYPYLTMEWVEGLALYGWAKRTNPPVAQVCQQLSQLAGALAELQAQQCVHRDVKGENVLVRLKDGRAFLTDLGTGWYPGAATLTPPLWLPGTPAYRAPQARQFELRFGQDSFARYRAGPADDVYGLGVTAYRLLTGRYPQTRGPCPDEAGKVRWEDVEPVAPHELNPRVGLRLSALCLRMLSVRPEARGSAAQLAEELEQVARDSGASRPQRLFVPEPQSAQVSPPTPRPAEVKPQVLEAPLDTGAPAEAFSPRAAGWLRLRRAATAAVVLLLAGGAWWAMGDRAEEPHALARHEAGRAHPEDDDDTAGLGEAVSLGAVQSLPAPSAQEVLAEEPQPEPVPGQARPDAKGRCPGKWQVALNGGCWAPLKGGREACEAVNGQLFKGTCYMPITTAGRLPTSHPTREP